MKVKIKKIIFITFILYVSIVGGLYSAQRDMIYFTRDTKPNIAPYEEFGVLQVETINSDKIKLTGWFLPPQKNLPVIIFFHGNASSIGYSIYKAMPYAEKGYGFLLASYRGYDSNDGSPSEDGFYSDARSWVKKLNSLKVNSDNIILYGESIGTGVAVQMATEFPNIKALVLESPYTSLPDVAARRYPFVPVKLLMKDKFDSLSKIKNIQSPFFVIQGAEDRLIPPEISQELFDAANKPKEILRLEGYGHNNMPEELKYLNVIKFLEEL